MRINKNGLDEMQKEKRNSIGNQMFLLMVYACERSIDMDKKWPIILDDVC